jgi:nitric oxide synthase-interacting protein
MCCLSLHPCRDPVITPQGYLYEREVVFEYILEKRKENERALEAWHEQEGAKAAADAHTLDDAHARTVEAFERAEHGLSP